MIGVTLKRKRDRATFRVVGRDGSCWTLAPVEHGPAISVSTLEASELFNVVGEAAEAVQAAEAVTSIFGRSRGEQAACEALATAHAAALARPRGPQGLAPEDSLRAGALSASEIVGTPRYLWAYQGQRLAVSSEVAAEVDRLLAEGEAE